MKVGDYVRTKKYGIKKILNIGEYLGMKQYLIDEDGTYTIDSSIIKSNSNILDLIEVGDYVNGGKVYKKEQNYVVINNDFGNLFEFMNIYENDIKSIVTREQFKEMEYRIGE